MPNPAVSHEQRWDPGWLEPSLEPAEFLLLITKQEGVSFARPTPASPTDLTSLQPPIPS